MDESLCPVNENKRQVDRKIENGKGQGGKPHLKLHCIKVIEHDRQASDEELNVFLPHTMKTVKILIASELVRKQRQQRPKEVLKRTANVLERDSSGVHLQLFLRPFSLAAHAEGGEVGEEGGC